MQPPARCSNHRCVYIAQCDQWESDKLTDTTNESQEASPFPAGDHKAHINRRAQRHSKHKTEKIHKKSTKEERSVKYFTGGLKPVSRRQR